MIVRKLTMKLEDLFEAEAKTLYCSRDLLNGEDLVKWAEAQGFKNCLSPDDMHVTIAYSKKKIDWSELTDSFDEVYSRKDGKKDKTTRAIKAFGEKGEAIVLTFENADLHRRWEEFTEDFGASWDHDGYHPHVTITYDGLPEGLKLEDIEPYEGELHFGPEKMAEVNNKWKSKVKEVKINEAEDRYFVQPDGSWKQVPADGRSAARTRAEVLSIGGKIDEAAEDVTETKAFKDWFRDSKVRDASGKPIVVYHGTASNFRAFNMKKQIMGTIWFTSDKSEIEAGNVGASGSGKILELYASIQNPAGWDEYDKFGIWELKSRGYDGCILPNKDGSFHGICFEPTQLKSAFQNNGNFDRFNKNLREDD